MVLKIVEQIRDTCCGGSTVDVNPSGLQTPWKPNNKANNKKEEDVPDTTKVPNNGIKVPKKKNKAGTFTDKEMKYEVTVWKDLPIKVRKACEELGYDKTKWDHSHQHLPIEHKHWKDLSQAELKALGTLGWEKEAWEHQYEEYDFHGLPDLQKKAAEAIGITSEETWNHWPKELEHKKWDDMTEEEKGALAVFGWHKSEWD